MVGRASRGQSNVHGAFLHSEEACGKLANALGSGCCGCRQNMLFGSDTTSEENRRLAACKAGKVQAQLAESPDSHASTSSKRTAQKVVERGALGVRVDWFGKTWRASCIDSRRERAVAETNFQVRWAVRRPLEDSTPRHLLKRAGAIARPRIIADVELEVAATQWGQVMGISLEHRGAVLTDWTRSERFAATQKLSRTVAEQNVAHVRGAGREAMLSGEPQDR